MKVAVAFLWILVIATGCTHISEEPSDDKKLIADRLLEGDVTENFYNRTCDEMPPGGRKLQIKPIGGTLAKVFNDSNYLHILSAEELGIEPLYDLSDAWIKGPDLVKIESCPEFYVEDLTHSVPFLVKESKNLLCKIGESFNRELQKRGGGRYRLKVTSITRTDASISKLRRRNVNASDNSAHRYGTTFDISYIKFACDSTDVVRTQEDLKNLLAEILKEKRDSGLCYVKYERKQGCFHITARKQI